MNIKTNDLFPTVFNDVFRKILRHEYTEYTFSGGRGSCKSSFISIVYAWLWLHFSFINGIVFRKYQKSLRNSVYAQMKWALNKLGARNIRYYDGMLKILNTKTNQVIIFAGVDDPEKTKSIRAEKGYFALIWYEEQTEFSQKEIIDTKLSVMRGGSCFWVFNSFNPPASARNWCNEDIRHEKKDRFVHKSDYRTTPIEWLGEAFLNEAEELKKRNLRSYENIFLGIATGTGANIFENVNLREISEEEINSFEWHYHGLDFGYYPDPLLYNSFAYDMSEKTLYIYDELKLYKHGNYEASEKLKEHLKNQFQDSYNFQNDLIIGDSAEPKSIADFRQWGWNMRGAIKGKGSLEAGMKWLQSLKKIVIDPKKCPEATNEFSLYEYEIDKKTGEILSGFPQGQPDHSIAAVRYGTEEIWRQRGN